MPESQEFSFEFSSLIERLIREEKLSVSKFERSAGLSNAALKTLNPTIKTLEKILNKYPKSKIWLANSLIGVTPTIAEEPEEKYGTLETLKELVESQKDTIRLLKQEIDRLEHGEKKHPNQKRQKT